ncbi:Damaged DNA binding,exodeoxyribonuclease IIIs isoform 5, partial [Theobroma cacao]
RSKWITGSFLVREENWRERENESEEEMSSSALEAEAPDLVCQLDNVQGMVDALSAVRWKRHQDAVVELSEHGVVLIVEDTGCLQAKVYLQRELFIRYEYNAEGRPRFGVSLGLFVDCLNTFSLPGRSSMIEIQYPGPDMQLLVKTRIPDTISWDYNFEPAGSTPLTFTVKSAALKEAIDDLEWPGSSIQILLQPVPPCVTFKGEGHGDLQIDFMYYVNTDLLIAFHCDRQVSY